MTDEAIRNKIRALLAKAESSEYQNESDAFFAKAAELMAQHAVDEAELGEKKEKPIVERRPFTAPAPYSMDKMLLVTSVTMALGAYAYYIQQARDGSKTRTNSKDHNTYMYLVGFPEDLDQVEVMLDSLMRQMELARARDQRLVSGGMGRKKVWNATYIRAYAARIGQRLNEAYQAVIEEQTGSTAIVLRNKKEQIWEELNKLGLRRTPTNRQADLGGAAAGRAAANQATINKQVSR